MDGIELKYQGKRSESEIISLVSDVKKIKLGKNPTYINGDNLIVMSSLLASGYNNSVDLIYIDPPYNTNQVFSVDNDRVSTMSRNGSVFFVRQMFLLLFYLSFDIISTIRIL